jgi:Dyp-type peroxidase family
VTRRGVELDDVQGLVRFGYGSLTDAVYVLARVRDLDAARAWLGSAPVSTAATLSPPPVTALQIAFTAPGLEALEVPAAVCAGFSSEFLVGMDDSNRARRLGDVESNASDRWEWGRASEVPHVLVMLFAKPGQLDEWVRRTLGDAWRRGFEETRRLTTSHLDGVEPFGFMDGISQPSVDWEQRRDPSKGGDGYRNDIALGEFLLGYRNEYGKYTDRPLIDVELSSTGLPLAEDVPGKWDVGRNGTYLVIRQLNQHVRDFWQYVASRAGGDRQAAETLASQLVGRTRQGEPLAQFENEIPGAAGTQARRLNQFTFDDDPAGVRCPFGAHIRRANPRNGDYAHHETGLKQRLADLGLPPSGFHDDVVSSVRFHRILRRGREFGPPLSVDDALLPAPPNDPDRGLYFICLNANISRQFEFIQNAWMTSTKFSALTGESDPLLGHRVHTNDGRVTDGFTMPTHGIRDRISELPAFVTVRGGAYFFLPGVRALRYLAGARAESGWSDMTTHEDDPKWKKAFAEEIIEVAKRRPNGAAVAGDLVGLAFSGGGIRSATFGLGVLETMKRLGMLKSVDYLSTVSGGGYIGGWLSAGCKRQPGWLERDADWTTSIDHLRRYSNYLSPAIGFFSADTWSMLTIWLRNTLLVQITVILAIACVLMLPRPLFELFPQWPNVGDWRWVTIILFIFGVVGISGNQLVVTGHDKMALLQARTWPVGLILGAVCIAAAWLYGRMVGFDPFHQGPSEFSTTIPIAFLLVLTGFILQPVAVRIAAFVYARLHKDPPDRINYTQGWVQGSVVTPMMIAAFLVTAILWGERVGAPGANVPPPDGAFALSVVNTYGALFTNALRYWPFPLSVVFASLWLLSHCSVSWRDWKSLPAAIGAPVVGVLVLHALLCAVMMLFHGWDEKDVWKAFVWGPPLVTGSFVLTIVSMIGMMGRQSTDGVREWWSRLGAWLGIYATAWMVITVAAVYGPQLVQWAKALHPLAMVTGGGGWVGTVIAGLFAGNSETTSGTGDPAKKSTATKVKEVIAVIAPFVFIAGLLIAIAYALDVVIVINAGESWLGVVAKPGDDVLPLRTVLLMLGAGCLVALVIVALRVDINEFSLNAFYRHRLVRCYLGATRFNPNERHPQNFTGFDDKDDLPLADLVEREGAARGPMHIVNCSLNLGGSSDLALHTRHSAAFTLTPVVCGSGYLSRTQAGETEELGFVPTTEYGGRLGAPTLGQAISVSGAAASPNMGYHTSPVVAFLLTLFNVRLGWWFPNPAKKATGYPSPHFNLSHLLAELFGGATDKSKLLMISDGGHFENLAAYELVRRRCRTIVISDGECDPTLTFEGLGTLIRMCEVDFGATITIDVKAIRPDSASHWSQARSAVGSITYRDGSVGTLVYLKASMTGREDTSVLQYKASHAAFPHESTSDQFYREDQFESYRRLGQDVAQAAFEPAANERDISTDQSRSTAAS